MLSSLARMNFSCNYGNEYVYYLFMISSRLIVSYLKSHRIMIVTVYYKYSSICSSFKIALTRILANKDYLTHVFCRVISY